ncbi:MAG: hypothetical protein SGPRY_004873, partial [Prymnesium sp.]
MSTPEHSCIAKRAMRTPVDVLQEPNAPTVQNDLAYYARLACTSPAASSAPANALARSNAGLVRSARLLNNSQIRTADVSCVAADSE